MPLFTPLVVASTVSSWFPTFIGLIGFKRMDRVWRVIGVLFVFMFLMEFLTFYLGLRYKNNIWLSNIITIVEGVVYLWAMSKWIRKGLIELLFRSILILFICFCTVTFLHYSIKDDVMYFGLVKGFFLFIAAASTLFNQSRSVEKFLLHDPVFLFAGGILLYNTLGELIIAISSYTVLFGQSAPQMVWNIHSWVNITSNLIYAFAIRFHQQSSRFSS